MDARRTTSICASPEFQRPLRPTRVPSRPSRQSALINYAHRLRIARNRHRLRHYYGRPRLYPAGLAADVERLHTLARNGDATAARRASSEALVWHGHLAPPVAAGAPSIRRLAPGARWRYTIGGCSGKERAPWMMSRSRQLAQVVTPDSWVRDPLHAYTPAARHEIACAGALSINDMQILGALDGNDTTQGIDLGDADDEKDPYHPPFLRYLWEVASSRPYPSPSAKGLSSLLQENIEDLSATMDSCDEARRPKLAK